MRKKWLVAAAATVLAAFIITLALLLADPGVWQQKLPDGSVMILRGVTYGKVHKLGVGNILQRAGGQLLPEPLSRRLGITILSHSNSVPELVVWVEHRNQTEHTRRPRGWYAATPIIVSDEAGTEYEQRGSSIASRSTNMLVEGYIFGAFPHASRNVSIRVQPFDYVGTNYYEANFRLPNPAFRREPPARPTTYPVSAQKDELSLTLERFSPGPPLEHTSRTGTEIWMKTIYRIVDKTNPASDWFVRAISVQDESGGIYHPNSTSGGSEITQTNFSFRGGLSTNVEWTLQFTLSRLSFASNELAVFTNVPISGRSSRTFEAVSAQLQGVTLTLTDFRKNGYIYADLSPSRQDLRLELVSIVDDQGRAARATVTGLAANSAYHFGTDLAADATSADLTFAVRSDRFIDLKARPVCSP